ncbi:uncharacterized protein [Lolium perenne]|uniref:uncharacterized protein n=1 Tax=Lolium perenne TaxID=4522 RepID=UPI003A98E154
MPLCQSVACVATAAAAGWFACLPPSPNMASAPTPATPKAPAGPAGRYAVYVAAVPLRAPQGPAQALMSAGYSLGLWDLQHFMVLLRPDPPRSQAPLVFDFQPRDPEDALAALAALSRSKIPGVVRRRTLRRIPDRRSWFVGLCDGDAADAAERFSERWSTDLVVGEHDCRDYTNGLVEVLTGEKRVLESLRASSGANEVAP